MDYNLKQLKKVPIIINIKRIQLTNEVKKILGSSLAKIAEDNGRKVFVYVITYISKGKKVIGYIVEPREGKRLPCIIRNRGGSRDFGSIKYGDLFGSYSSLARKGYIVITTQYPGVAGGDGIDKMGGEEDIASILDLYKILKSYGRADITKVGMYGHSRGGTMTYMCLARVKWIKAAVAIASPVDELNAPNFRNDWAEHQKRMYGGSLQEKKKRSAILWVDKFCKKTPLLIMHGTSDWRVNPLDSVKLAEKLYENKIPYRLIMYEGADHGLTEVSKNYWKEVFEWFDRFLKKDEKLPNLKPHGK